MEYNRLREALKKEFGMNETFNPKQIDVLVKFFDRAVEKVKSECSLCGDSCNCKEKL